MLIKAGVDISKLNKEIRRALSPLESIYVSLGKELIITSTYEGTHMASSLHYHNDAIDIRWIPELAPKLIEKIKLRLGNDYDVVEETGHFHIEYDPKQ